MAVVGLGLVATPALLLLGMCSPPPGRGVVAERLYGESAPIIVALERFRQARGEYPDSLPQLVPGFLDRGSFAVAHLDRNGPVEYRRDSLGYALTFRYDGPGRNSCTHRGGRSDWACGGYF